jgi:hypothetical protein
MKNILTVDVEDWFHICDIEHILPRSDWDRCETHVLQNVERILSLLVRLLRPGYVFCPWVCG